jgi:dihydrofolate reductase
MSTTIGVAIIGGSAVMELLISAVKNLLMSVINV